MTGSSKAYMRTYETICLTKVDMPEDKFTTLTERLKAAVTTEGKGQWLYSDDWGRAKIAFTIGKDNRARWTYYRYKCTADGVNEVRRALGINEFVLRFSTVKADDEGKDYEPIRQGMVQDLQDREKTRDAWREERNARRGGGGYGGGGDRGGGGGYRGGGDRGGGGGDYQRGGRDQFRDTALPGSVIADDDGDETAGA